MGILSIRASSRSNFSLSSIFIIFLFILPFVLLTDAANKTELPQWSLSVVFSALLGLAWLLTCDHRITWTPLHTLVALTSGTILALGTLHAGIPGVQDAMLQQITLALFFFLGAQLLSSERGRCQLLTVTVAAGSLVALIGIAQYISGSSLGLPALSSNPSVFINKNWAGAFMDLATPAALVLLLAVKGRRAVALAAVGSFLCLSYSFISLSRGHWLALAATLVMLLILLWNHPELRAKIKRDRQRLAIAAAVILAAPVMLAAPAMLPLPPNSAERPLAQSSAAYKVTDSSSINLRSDFYRNTLRMIADSPLTGTGPGSYYTGFQDYYGNPVPVHSATELIGIAHAHNDYLEYLAELGIPGGVLMITLLALIWFSAWKMANDRRSPVQSLMGAAFLVGITAVLSHAMVDFPLSLPVSSIFLWTWAGAISTVWISNPDKKTTARLNPRLRAPLALLALFYLGLVSLHGYTALKANILIGEAARLTVRKECDRARELADEALFLGPKDYLIWHHQLVVHSACKSDIQTLYGQASLVLEQAPSHPYALLVRANALLQAGEYDLASDDYRKLIRLLPHRASGYLGLANTLAMTGDIPGAQAGYKNTEEIIKRIGKHWKAGPAGQELATLTQKIMAYNKRQMAEKADITGTPSQNSARDRVIVADDG